MSFSLQKLTLESGFLLLEKEFKNVVQAASLQADHQTLVDALDDQYGEKDEKDAFVLFKRLQYRMFDENVREEARKSVSSRCFVELIAGRGKNVVTARQPEKIAKLAEWLLKRGRSRKFLGEYAKIR